MHVPIVKRLAPLALLAASCVPDKPRLNSPPQGFEEPQSPMVAYYAYHNDQGMLADMSIADIHFVAHQPVLSAAGEARMARYAELLATFGGTIHYDTALTDEKLLKSRLVAANDFLKKTVPGSKPVTVAIGLAGGRGMSAKEAKGALDVAAQPEPRENAYYLRRFQDVGAGE
jgi:hypothetical protein